ncbi:MAG: YggS family pyridoxal phosphate-dependent enzyme [Planctomycetota bacterium]|nr:YggS family pyridoxal phosphate-dependent enzyme [Planctomycetota bacterium]
MAVTRKKIESNLERIRERIVAACAKRRRKPGDVRIVAVTKGTDIEALKFAVELGLTDLGESRSVQLGERAEELAGWLARRRTGGPVDVRWHMVGHLQRNKVRAVLPVVACIHSVDSLRLAEEINLRAEKLDRVVDIFLQVNCSEEPQKSGCAVGAAQHLAGLVCTLKNLRLVGLMTMGPLSENPEDARAAFVRLRELFEDIRHDGVGGDAFREVSMGMSQDYDIAVEEGATMLRIGSALFE